MANQIISGTLENRKTNLKEYYVLCARLFLIDTFLWGAMFSREDEIFYQDIKTSEVWKEILKRHQEIKIDKDLKLMKSHEKFTVGVCTGLAGISKGSTYDDGLKKGAMTLTYLSVYFFAGSKREN